MIRIRYTRNPDTGYLFSKPILVGNGSVVVTLVPESKSFTITSFEDGSVLVQDSSTSMPSLKRLAKKWLRELGASFEDEVRENSADSNIGV